MPGEMGLKILDDLTWGRRTQQINLNEVWVSVHKDKIVLPLYSQNISGHNTKGAVRHWLHGEWLTWLAVTELSTCFAALPVLLNVRWHPCPIYQLTSSAQAWVDTQVARMCLFCHFFPHCPWYYNAFPSKDDAILYGELIPVIKVWGDGFWHYLLWLWPSSKYSVLEFHTFCISRSRLSGVKKTHAIFCSQCSACLEGVHVTVCLQLVYPCQPCTPGSE